jgi:hypothetical protein
VEDIANGGGEKRKIKPATVPVLADKALNSIKRRIS